MKEEKKVFVLKDAKGKEVEYEEWFSFSSTETGKDYLVCSDNEKDDKGNIKVYVFIYDPEKEENEILQVMKTGYMYKDRVLVYAMVKVNKKPEEKKITDDHLNEDDKPDDNIE